MAKKSQELSVLAGNRVKILIDDYNKANPDNKVTQKQLANEVLYTSATAFNEKLRGVNRSITVEDAIALGNFFGVNYKWILGEEKYRNQREWFQVEFLSRLDEANVEANLLYKGIEAFAELAGISISVAPTPDCDNPIKKAIKKAHAGFILERDGKQVHLSLSQFSELGNKLFDMFDIEMKYLFRGSK